MISEKWQIEDFEYIIKDVVFGPDEELHEKLENAKDRQLDFYISHDWDGYRIEGERCRDLSIEEMERLGINDLDDLTNSIVKILSDGFDFRVMNGYMEKRIVFYDSSKVKEIVDEKEVIMKNLNEDKKLLTMNFTKLIKTVDECEPWISINLEDEQGEILNKAIDKPELLKNHPEFVDYLIRQIIDIKKQKSETQDYLKQERIEQEQVERSINTSNEEKVSFFSVIRDLKNVYKSATFDPYEEDLQFHRLWDYEVARDIKLKGVCDIKLNSHYLKHTTGRNTRDEVLQEFKDFLKNFKYEEDLNALKYAQSLIEKEKAFSDFGIDKDLIKVINNRRMVIGLEKVKPIKIEIDGGKNRKNENKKRLKL